MFGRTFFDNHAAVHKYDFVCNVARKSHLVRYDDHRKSRLCKLFHDFEHFAHHFGIESGSGLVKQDDFGGHRKGARNCHALF